MKSITICQPYAHLIVTPETELPSDVQQKRVENRTWAERYRGPLLIHAGKSRKYLGPKDDQIVFDAYGLRIGDMAFGVIVGMVNMIDCISIEDIDTESVAKKYPWLPDHEHAEGPWCHIYENAVRFSEPIPLRGALGLFNVDDEMIASQLAASSKAKGQP